MVAIAGLPAALIFLSGFIGCGTTKSFMATEQLLVSDAVDSTVAQIDFSPLVGRRAFIDNTFLPTQKGVPNPNPALVHSDYVSSSLRQQMLAAGVMLCDKRDDADTIVEVRLGALGFDAHSVTYGIPASNTLSSAASTLGGSPFLPLLPELSFAKKEAKSGAAKVALFAYDRQTLQPLWQSGIARSTSTARDTWLLGIGPLQHGTIYEGTRFAGSRVFPENMVLIKTEDQPQELGDYKRSQIFSPLSDPEADAQLLAQELEAKGGASTAASVTSSATASAVTPTSASGSVGKASGVPPVGTGPTPKPLPPLPKGS